MLTVPDCPHRVATLDRLREALALTGRSDVVVSQRQVNDLDEALAAGMLGSPTILVEGRDIFDSSAEPSLSCRLYRSDAGLDGAPSVAALVDALR